MKLAVQNEDGYEENWLHTPAPRDKSERTPLLSSGPSESFRVYRSRFYILMVYSMLTFFQSMPSSVRRVTTDHTRSGLNANIHEDTSSIAAS